MKFKANRVYHVCNQGNNRQIIFREPDNYRYFQQKIQRYISPYADILCYCLMPNHFHLLLQPNATAALPSKAVKPCRQSSDVLKTSDDLSDHYQENLSHAIAILLSSYTKAFNRRYNRSGSLFRSRTKVKDGRTDPFFVPAAATRSLSVPTDLAYARQCFQYIHHNPVKAGLVIRATEWPHSSAQDYAGLRRQSLCNTEVTRQLLGDTALV